MGYENGAHEDSWEKEVRGFCGKWTQRSWSLAPGEFKGRSSFPRFAFKQAGWHHHHRHSQLSIQHDTQPHTRTYVIASDIFETENMGHGNGKGRERKGKEINESTSFSFLFSICICS